MLARVTQPWLRTLATLSQHVRALRFGRFSPAVLAGMLMPCGFAPFHLPGLALLGLALLFFQLQTQRKTHALWVGIVFGLAFMGTGVSWVYVSIHEYGHLHPLWAGLITALFVGYLSLFFGLMAWGYHYVMPQSPWLKGLYFSACWCLSEWARASFLGGFPWLLLGFGQIDTPLRYLFPLTGVYGVSFAACFAATCLATAMSLRPLRTRFLCLFVSIILVPMLWHAVTWSTLDSKPWSVAVVQANVAMREKWDERLFWRLLNHYQTQIHQNLSQHRLIVLPESAIPVPKDYVDDVLDALHHEALAQNSAVLLGIPQARDPQHAEYYNTLSTLGHAQGTYLKQQLVPFGEFIPAPFLAVMQALKLPTTSMQSGPTHQPLLRVHHHPMASLICYELAYPALLRQQLPEAEWIVSVSDDGWFGHSLAIYQQLQLAQALSLETARFQIMANNDGLSSIINAQGEVIASLPAFRAGVLSATIRPAHGATPWVRLGDAPMLGLCFVLVLAACWRKPRVHGVAALQR